MRWALGSLIAASLVVPGVLAADDGPAARIIELVQEMQDVEIVVEIPDDPPNYFETKYKVVREFQQEQMEVTGFEFFDVADAVHSIESCKGRAEEYCTEHPNECEDCNGDGVLECYTPCYTLYHFEIVDSCVPPVMATYLLIGEQGHGHSDEAISVSDTGDECLEAPRDDADSDSADSCSTTSVGRAVAPHVFALVMLVIGLVAARAGRER